VDWLAATALAVRTTAAISTGLADPDLMRHPFDRGRPPRHYHDAEPLSDSPHSERRAIFSQLSDQPAWTRPDQPSLCLPPGGPPPRPDPAACARGRPGRDRNPDARSPRARATARSSPGRLVARVEIFWEKIRGTPTASSEAIWVSRDWQTVERGRNRSARPPAAAARAAPSTPSPARALREARR